MDISSQNFDSGVIAFVDDNEYSNFAFYDSLKVSMKETTPKAIERLNAEISDLQSRIKSIPFPNSFMGKSRIKDLKNEIDKRVNLINEIKANGTYCERNNNCPKSAIGGILQSVVSKIKDNNAKVPTDITAIKSDIKSDTKKRNRIDSIETQLTQYESPITEQPQDTETDNQTPVQSGMSTNTKLIIGAIAVIGIFYLLKK